MGKTNWLTIDGTRLSFTQTGSGEPVILVHGLSASGRWWSKCEAAFAEHFAVYAIDLVGFGNSRGRQRFVLTDAARLLAGWMDTVGIRRAHLVGHSMGGFVAAHFAAEFPERVARIVLVDAAVPLPNRSLFDYVVTLGRELGKTRLRSMPLLAIDALRAGAWTILDATDQLLKTSITQDLSKIQAPVLLVWGEKDMLVPLSVADHLAQLIPNTEQVVLAGAYHNIILDHPEEFNEAALAFLLADAEKE